MEVLPWRRDDASEFGFKCTRLALLLSLQYIYTGLGNSDDIGNGLCGASFLFNVSQANSA